VDAPPGPQPLEVSGVFSGVVSDGRETARAGIRIGRASDNDVVLDDLLVSLHHAELRKRPEGGYELADLGSANGTFVNGRRVKLVALEERDVVTVGHHLFHLVRGRLEEYVDDGLVSFRAAGLTVHTAAGHTLLDDVSFGLDERSFLAVVGPSGSGKSTLLNALTGFRPAGTGAVSYDGRDLYENYEELRLRIGFVPQQDVLHPALTVRQALGYAAELRFPADVGAAERSRRVEEVLGELGLADAGDRRIHLLSGGQRRRVAVAVELLDKPSLLFLDEPTSGLDPGYERSLMDLLRSIADGGHTVVVVTHSVQSIRLCDRVLFLAPGGRPAYFGPPQLAPAFFGREDFQQIFQDLSSDRRRDWSTAFRGHRDYERFVQRPSGGAPVADGNTSETRGLGLRSAAAARSRSAVQRLRARVALAIVAHRAQLPVLASPTGWLGQFWMLTRRYARVIAGDRRNLALLLAQPAILGLLMLVALPAHELAAPDAGEVRVVSRAGLVLLVVMLGATWLGASNAVREIVKELPIVRRERAVGLSISAYLGSKAVVLGALTAVQCTVLAAIAFARQGSHDTGSVLSSPLLELVAAAILTGLAAMGLGLLVSALSSTVDRAMTVLPVLLILQMLLAMGGVFPDVVEKPGLKQASYLAGAQWGFATAASTVDLDRLQSVDKFASEAPTIRLDDPLAEFESVAEDLRPNERWSHEGGTWLANAAVLVGLAAAGIGGAGLALRRQRPEA
jgi:ABC transport system ATP-binding/permease protein